MPHNMIILYFRLPYFHVSNSVWFLYSILVLSIYIDAVLTLFMQSVPLQSRYKDKVSLYISIAMSHVWGIYIIKHRLSARVFLVLQMAVRVVSGGVDHRLASLLGFHLGNKLLNGCSSASATQWKWNLFVFRCIVLYNLHLTSMRNSCCLPENLSNLPLHISAAGIPTHNCSSDNITH